MTKDISRIAINTYLLPQNVKESTYFVNLVLLKVLRNMTFTRTADISTAETHQCFARRIPTILARLCISSLSRKQRPSHLRFSKNKVA